MAALRSALISNPHDKQRNPAWEVRLPAATCPQVEQRWLVW